MSGLTTRGRFGVDEDGADDDDDVDVKSCKTTTNHSYWLQNGEWEKTKYRHSSIHAL